jgi:hypothetical protein
MYAEPSVAAAAVADATMPPSEQQLSVQQQQCLQHRWKCASACAPTPGAVVHTMRLAAGARSLSRFACRAISFDFALPFILYTIFVCCCVQVLVMDLHDEIKMRGHSKVQHLLTTPDGFDTCSALQL